MKYIPRLSATALFTTPYSCFESSFKPSDLLHIGYVSDDLHVVHLINSIIFLQFAQRRLQNQQKQEGCSVVQPPASESTASLTINNTDAVKSVAGSGSLTETEAQIDAENRQHLAHMSAEEVRTTDGHCRNQHVGCMQGKYQGFRWDTMIRPIEKLLTPLACSMALDSLSLGSLWSIVLPLVSLDQKCLWSHNQASKRIPDAKALSIPVINMYCLSIKKGTAHEHATPNKEEYHEEIHCMSFV